MTAKLTSSKSEPGPILSVSDYEYRVSLGTVEAKNSIRWDGGRYNCQKWEDVERLVGLWEQECDTPAVEVKLNYRGESTLP